MRLIRFLPVLPLLAGSLGASAAPDVQGRAGPVLTATTNRPESSTFAIGEPVTITFHAAKLTPGTSSALALAVTDDRGQVVARQTVNLTADGAGNADFAFPAPHGRYGYYEVAANLAGGVTIAALGTRPRGIITYAVVPDPAERPDYGPAHSRFGMQGGFSPRANIMPLLGVRYHLAGTTFANLEPKAPGQFPADRAAALAKGQAWPVRLEQIIKPQWNGKPWTIYPLAQIAGAALPEWARKPGTEGTACRNFGALNESGRKRLPGFAADVARAMMADYPDVKPRIYQVTWEPANGWCYNGTPAELVEYYRLTYEVLHRIDPEAIVAGPTLYPNQRSTSQMNGLWHAGLAKYLDALSLHASAGQPPETTGIPDLMRAQIAAGERSVGGRRIGLVSTEHGTHSGVLGNRGKAQVDTRIALIMLGEGALMDTAFYVADFWNKVQGMHGRSLHTQGFYWNLDETRPFGTFSMSPKMVVPVYAAMTRLIDGTTTGGRLPGLSGTQIGYRFVRGRTIIDAVWDYGAGSSLAVPRGKTVCDWMGNCGPSGGDPLRLTASPAYILSTAP